MREIGASDEREAVACSWEGETGEDEGERPIR